MRKTLIALTITTLSLFVILPWSATSAAQTTASPQQVENQRLNARIKAESLAGDELPDPSTLPKPKFPHVALHAIYLVETNQRGQVVRVRAGSPSTDKNFNTITYYNALQTFIHSTEGSATAGVFRLTYDYTPTNQMIKRDVTLVQRGGVNPNAPGAVDVMFHHAPKPTSTP